MMKRVCHFTSVHSPQDTRIYHKECRSLARRGYEVHLVAPMTGPSREQDGVFLHPVLAGRSRAARMTRTAFDTVRQARALNASLYHFHDPELLPYALALLQGKPMVFDVHEHVALQLRNKEWLPARELASRVYAGLEMFLTKGRVRLVLAEESYFEAYRRADPRACVVLNYPIVNGSRAPASHRASPARLVYLGTVARKRGINEMLETVRLLLDRGHAVTFDCIGPFPAKDEQHWFARAAELRLGDRVRFHGRLDQPEAMRIVERASVGFCLLHPDPNYVRSYPTKAFEYMTAGIPFVLSNFPFYEERIGTARCCVFTDPLDPAQTADAVAGLLGDPERARQMGERGRKAVLERFCWASQERGLLALYDELIGPPS
ncbi:MAG: glycosyltransferase [Deltaproteobacteria bacterium]|nr:glycosyltransferase [Deltaproteobacteria bacterium]